MNACVGEGRVKEFKSEACKLMWVTEELDSGSRAFVVNMGHVCQSVSPK